MKKSILLMMVVFLATGSVAYSQKERAPQKVPAGSKLFIAPMEGNLHPFIATEILKKKLPVVVVTEEKDADFILTGASIRGDDRWLPLEMDDVRDQRQHVAFSFNGRRYLCIRYRGGVQIPRYL